MTLASEPGVDTPAPCRHSSLHMQRATAYAFFGSFGFFSPKTLGGCLDA
jgi:hypothetical protein